VITMGCQISLNSHFAFASGQTNWLPVVKSKVKDRTTLLRKVESMVGDCCTFMQREVEALRLLNFEPKLCVCFTFVLIIFVKLNVRI
jgi:hypothetical protein